MATRVSTWEKWWKDVVVAATRMPPAAPEPDETPVTPRRKRGRTVIIAMASAVLSFGAGVVVTGDWWQGTDPSLAYGVCAEAIGPTTRVGHVALLADRGPHGKPNQDRLIELRVQKHPDRGWIAWAYLEQTTSDLDRLWLDWTYVGSSTSNQSEFRQCGAQPVTDARATPALLVNDEQDRPRWFRACGQVPSHDRAPDQSGTFCTSWTRPRI